MIKFKDNRKPVANKYITWEEIPLGVQVVEADCERSDSRNVYIIDSNRCCKQASRRYTRLNDEGWDYIIHLTNIKLLNFHIVIED